MIMLLIPTISFLVERIGHAMEKVRDFDLSLIDAIVTASGDGIINEVSSCSV